MKPDFFTLPNMMSLLRLILVIPFVLVMTSGIEHAKWWGVVIILVGAATDKLDGDLARWLHCESEWGRILDPLADKVAVAAIALVLLWLGAIPVWFVVILLARDLLILAGGVFIRRKTGAVLPSNPAGKWAVGLISLTLFLALIDHTMIAVPLGIGVSLVMVLLSTAGYAKRFLEVYRTQS